MNISKKDVQHVANLSRLSLSDEETSLYTGQLNSILEFVEKLNEIDTTDVKPMSHALDITNALRADEVNESVSSDLALKNAPDPQDNQFKVPTVMEG